MISLISFILTISFLIFIHELGHLLAAKWAKVKVENFSIGFGPKLFSFNIGETEYSFSLLPLGGYVKMQGEDISEIKESGDIESVDPSRSYKNISNFKKQIILFAGPAMNLLLPFLFLPLVYINGLEVPSFLYDKPIVGHVKKDADSSLFMKGDRIVEINGTYLMNWEDIRKARPANLGIEQTVSIERGGIIKNIIFKNQEPNKIYILDFVFPIQPPIVDQILTGSIADKIGLMKSDEIIRINTTPINSWYQISEELNYKNKYIFEITIKRNQEILKKEAIFKGKERMLGITPEIKSDFLNFGFSDSFIRGYHHSIKMIGLIFNGIVGLFSDLFSSESSLSELKNSLAGPISIAKYSGLAAEKGFNSIIQFVVVISINLGIINLLPIPLLDGGHIFFNTLESITRRKINPIVQNTINKIGFAILISLMLFAIYNDIVNF